MILAGDNASPFTGRQTFALVTAMARPKLQTGQHAYASRATGLAYLLYLPEDYAKGRKRWPLLLFLHASDERGHDLNLVKAHGPPKFLDGCADFPFIIVAPQCPSRKYWEARTLSALLDEVAAICRVDANRVYATGLSMGGFGTWALALAQPQRFAAIAPISGGGNSRQVARLKPLPVWIFHGAHDDCVSPEESLRMARALEKCGGNVRLTIYPDAGHDAWTQTYENPAFYEWLLEHKRGS
jgi:predicted peptidase